MSNRFGSTLQKINFVLLLLIAAALGYLIARNRIDARRALSESALVTLAAPVDVESRRNALPEAKSSFAPLRARVDTNAARAVSSRVIVSPRNGMASPPQQASADAVVAEATSTPHVPPLPVPVAMTGSHNEAAEGASIRGRVTLRGQPPLEKPVVLDVTCGRLHPQPMTTRHYVVGEDGGLANVFVYVKSGIAPQRSAQPTMPVLDNVNCEFQPYVLGVRAGQPFMIRNSDPVLHNAHVLARKANNSEFNIGLPVTGTTAQRVLRNAEVFVQVKCDVHPWMFAYIGVVDHPWFAVTDANGNFALPSGLARGRYTVAAVHVKAGESVQEISIEEGAPAPLSFTLNAPDTLAKNGAR